MKRGREEPPGVNPTAKRPAGLTTSDALSYLREVKNRFQHQKEVYDTFLEIMKEFKAARIDTSGVIVRVKDLFKGHKELILGFNTFLPRGYEIELAEGLDTSEDEKVPPPQLAYVPIPQVDRSKQPVEFDQAISYVNKIKTRFANDERVYKAFLEILNMYRKGTKSINTVYEEVAILFKSHADLLQEFTYFLPENSPPPQGSARARMQARAAGQQGRHPNRVITQAPGAGAAGGPGAGDHAKIGLKRKGMRKGEEDDVSKAKEQLVRELQMFERFKSKLRNKDAYADFLKCLNLFAMEIITKQELLSLVHDIIGRNNDLMLQFNEFLARCEALDVDLGSREGGSRPLNLKDLQKLRAVTAREKYLNKPISEQDFVNDKEHRCTASYVKFPADYPRLECRGRGSIAPQIRDALQDIWVSVTTGSEDYSFKQMRKNQYEENLFKCEDDHYELDMVIEQNASTIRALKPLVERMAPLDAAEKQTFQLPKDALGPFHWRCIQRIYGDSGPQVTNLLRKVPAVAAPVVLVRLEQKDREWRKVRDDMTPMWRRIFEQNYHKSLDHRSFYFKQAEKKTLVPKAMLTEIRDIAERRRQDERHLRAVSAACSFESTLQPDITYPYPDRAVHDDCYKIIRHAIEEQVHTTEQRQAVLELWLMVVEPFFGLPRREAELSECRKGRGQEGVVRAPAAGRAAGKGQPRKAAASGDGEEEESEETEDEEGADDDKSEGENAGAGAAEVSEGQEGAEEGEEKEEKDEEEAEEKEEELGAPRVRDAVAVEAEEEDQEVAKWSYRNCKPLAAQGAQVAAEQPRNVLYGNDHLYLLFRYHQHFYDRLTTARKCCLAQKDRPQFREAHGQESSAEAAARQEVERLHDSFLTMVQGVLDGGLDIAAYEDQCRSLLGTNSYTLFTLDKLILKLVRHMQTMVADDVTNQLVELWAYESARGEGVSDSVYRANTHTLLHEEPVFRLAFTPQQALTVQLLDLDKTEVLPICDQSFNHCVRYLIHSTSSYKRPRADGSAVFLLRNVRRAAVAHGLAPTLHPNDELPLEVLQTVHICNGLECKIHRWSLDQQKAGVRPLPQPGMMFMREKPARQISYVLDTEDVMYRDLASSAGASSSGRSQRRALSHDLRQRRFDAWLSRQVGALRLTSVPREEDKHAAAAAAPPQQEHQQPQQHQQQHQAPEQQPQHQQHQQHEGAAAPQPPVPAVAQQQQQQEGGGAPLGA